jgi:hypothetical protein
MHTRREKLVFITLLFTLALGFITRMGWPTLAEFKRDEATVARLAQAIAYEGYLPVTGVDSSLGIDNLPLTLYLMALPIRLWPDPLSAVLFTALLNSLALLACYVIGKTFFNRNVALIATWLFAVNPWAILYARKIWCRTLPLFTLGFMASLFYTFIDGKQWALVGAFISLAGLLGLQLEGLAFVPILIFALTIYRDKVAWKPLLIGSGLFALALAPYGIHDALHQWDNLRGLINYSAGGGKLSLDALRYALMLTGSAGIEGQAGAYHVQFRNAVPPLWWMNTGMMLLTLAALLYALHEAIRGKTLARRRTFTLMSLWFWIPVALQLRPGDSTQIHYFVTQYPAQFLLVASLLTAGLKRLSCLQRPAFLHSNNIGWKRLNLTISEVVLILVLFTWGSWQTAVAMQRLRFMIVHPTTGGYGIPLRYTRQAAQAAKNLALTNDETHAPADIIVLSQETHPLITETPTVFDALLFGHSHRFADIQWTLPLSRDGYSVYLLGPVQATPNEASAPPASSMPIKMRLESLANVEAGPTVLPPGGVQFLTYRYMSPGPPNDRTDMLKGMEILPTGVLFANKVVFAAYDIPNTIKTNTTLQVWLAWWLQGPPASTEDYHFTVQLLDQAGNLHSQCDHAGFPSRFWQVGDLVLSYFTLPIPDKLPSGAYHVQAGMYTYPDITNVPVVDHEGNPLHSGLKLADIKVIP